MIAEAALAGVLTLGAQGLQEPLGASERLRTRLETTSRRIVAPGAPQAFPEGFRRGAVSWKVPLALHTGLYGLDLASSYRALRLPGTRESGSLGPGLWVASVALDLALQRLHAPRWLLWGGRIVVTGLRLGASWHNFTLDGTPTDSGRKGDLP